MRVSPKLERHADKRDQHTPPNMTSMCCSSSLNVIEKSLWLSDQVVWAAGLVPSMWQNLYCCKYKSPTWTCLDIFSCEVEEVCQRVSNQGPFSLEMLTACGAQLMTEAECPATPSAVLLSALPPGCLESLNVLWSSTVLSSSKHGAQVTNSCSLTLFS